jgi:hypothetical protein
MLVGFISDTHGLLRPEALDALRGCELIIHAGDVGSPDIVPALAEVLSMPSARTALHCAGSLRVSELMDPRLK